MDVKEYKHLYQRAAFGYTLANWQKDRKLSREKLVKKLLKQSERFEPLETGEIKQFSRQELKMLSDEERKALKMSQRDSIKSLNVGWINRMANSPHQLREKMTLFWHDHFACRLPLQFGATVRQNNLLRQHALGSFQEMLHAISKDAGMLRFLNNQQNRKDHPNENFARELLELFTLGRGHYTETDIKEAARAFTGWSSNLKGEFVFRRFQHDRGEKSFMGQKGNFGGEEILDMVLANPQTAHFITEKLYRYFVNQEIDPAVVKSWAQHFYDTNYDIAALLFLMFSSDHFYETKHMGRRIKSPVEYIVHLMRNLNLYFTDKDGPLLIQRVLGQVLFNPPNVSGWPEGKAWIDSSSLMTRLRIPMALIMAAELEVQGKDAFAGNEDVIKAGDRKLLKKLQAVIEWDKMLRHFQKISRTELIHEMRDYFLQLPAQQLDQETLAQFVRGKNDLEKFKILVMRLLCTPEYQFC
ncbi:MAG: DUF1800 domain-containing protein [Bacteroidota bacterium]